MAVKSNKMALCTHSEAKVPAQAVMHIQAQPRMGTGNFQTQQLHRKKKKIKNKK